MINLEILTLDIDIIYRRRLGQPQAAKSDGLRPACPDPGFSDFRHGDIISFPPQVLPSSPKATCNCKLGGKGLCGSDKLSIVGLLGTTINTATGKHGNTDGSKSPCLCTNT